MGSARQLFNQSQGELAADEEGEAVVVVVPEQGVDRRCKFGMYGPSVSFDGNRIHAVRPHHAGAGYHTIAMPPRHRAQLDSTASDGGAFWRYSSQDSGFSGRSDARDACGSEGTLANSSDCDGDCFSSDDYRRFHRSPDAFDHDTDPSG